MTKKKTKLFSSVALILLTVLLISALTACSLFDRTPKKLVSFNTDGGGSVPQQSVTGDYATEPTEPTKRGYTFLGWSYNGTPWNFATDKVESNMTLTARWEAIVYTVTYLNCEGVNADLDTEYIASDASFVLPTELTKNGCALEGWYKDEALTKRIEAFTPSALCENITVYAKWVGEDCTITYMNCQNATLPEDAPTSYKVGTTAPALPTPTMEHFTFNGWFRDAALTEQITEINTLTDGSLKLYASWALINYTVTYENCEGIELNLPTSYTIYNAPIVLPRLQVDHYSFFGWFKDADLTEEISSIDCSLGANITVYAGLSYTPHTYESTYTYDSEAHWLEANCGCENEINGYGTHTVDEDGKCSVCGFDAGLVRLKELLSGFAPSIAIVSTEMTTPFAVDPLTGRYEFTFTTDGAAEIDYTYTRFTTPDEWLQSPDAFATESGTAQLSTDGTAEGISALIIGCAKGKFNFTSHVISYATDGDTITVNVKGEGSFDCLGFDTGADLTFEFVISDNEIASVTLTYSAQTEDGTEVPTEISVTYFHPYDTI